MNAPTVFRDGCGTNSYRCAVATIIGDIENATGHSLIDIAETIGTTRETVSNAKNGKTSLSAEFLARIGRKYGAAYLNPYLALFGAQAAPLDRATKDILPLLTIAAHTVACARDPESPGGVVEVPQEKAACLRPFKALQRELGGQIAQIEAVLA